MAKQKSRATRWAEAVQDAQAALQELIDLKDEYQEWLDNLPENFQNSPVGEKLQAVCDIDLESAYSIIDECDTADLPQGFGRD